MRRSHALAGRALHRYQMQSHDVYELREAIAQALALLRHERVGEAIQVLTDAVK